MPIKQCDLEAFDCHIQTVQSWALVNGDTGQLREVYDEIVLLRQRVKELEESRFQLNNPTIDETKRVYLGIGVFAVMDKNRIVLVSEQKTGRVEQIEVDVYVYMNLLKFAAEHQWNFIPAELRRVL